MLIRVNLKFVLATVIALTSTISFAATQTMECAVSEPPDIFHDVIVRKEGAAITVVYSYLAGIGWSPEAKKHNSSSEESRILRPTAA